MGTPSRAPTAGTLRGKKKLASIRCHRSDTNFRFCFSSYGEQDGTPDGPKLHSILIDPRAPNHMYLGLSSGGVFESGDQGHDWQPLNAGCRADFLPDPYPKCGHDPHRVCLHPLAPDILYQQNHCGIYRMDRQEGTWVRIGEHMPQEVGDIGFPLVLHPRDPHIVWVFPMDGSACSATSRQCTRQCSIAWWSVKRCATGVNPTFIPSTRCSAC